VVGGVFGGWGWLGVLGGGVWGFWGVGVGFGVPSGKDMREDAYFGVALEVVYHGRVGGREVRLSEKWVERNGGKSSLLRGGSTNRKSGPSSKLYGFKYLG